MSRRDSTATCDEPPAVVVRPDDQQVAVELHGCWTRAALGRHVAAMRRQLRRCAAEPRTQWDLRTVRALDRMGALIVWRAWGGQRPADAAIPSGCEPLFAAWDEAPPPQPPAVDSIRQRLKALPARVLRSVREHGLGLAAVVGQLALDAARIVRRPRLMPLREISYNLHQVGARALVICALLGLLVGVVIAYLSSLELQSLGAEGFTVYLLGLSVIRELGPLLTAILVAARSGSAMTAELGVMNVTQELDAMAALGLPRSLRLLLPKIIALVIALPLLSVWTSSAALFGGMVATQQTIAISSRAFIAELGRTVPSSAFWLGTLKAAAFGLLIGIAACYFGLRTARSSSSLARETTNSVVAAVMMIIACDALFAVVFRGLGMR